MVSATGRRFASRCESRGTLWLARFFFFLKIHFESVDLDGVGEIQWINIVIRVCVWTGTYGTLDEDSLLVTIHSLRYAAFVAGRKAVV